MPKKIMPKKIMPTKLSTDTILMIILIALVLIAGYYFISSSNVSESFSSDIMPADGSASFVMFYADWCPHCQTAKPKLEDLKKQLSSNGSKINNTRIKVHKVNCEENKALANKYNITGYPTFKLIKNDNQVVDYEGGASQSQFKHFLEKNVD